MNLYINGSLATISAVQCKGQINYPPMPKWLAVYVNGCGSCHSLPADWFNTKDKRVCKTNGNIYEWR